MKKKLDKYSHYYIICANPERSEVRDLIQTFGDKVRWKFEGFASKGKSNGVAKINRKGKSNFRKGHSGFSFYRHFAINPPSTTISVPVIYLASSDTRNNDAFATSQASPILPMGI